MKLYLVQHGEAVAKELDPVRPLSERGQADVERLAAFLEGRFGVDRILHSGKERARQTAEILAASLSLGRPLETVDGINPKDDVEPFAGALQKESEDMLVAGHLPFMARLTALLVTGSDNAIVADYRPGSMVCLERDENGKWTIQWMVRPELLDRDRS